FFDINSEWRRARKKRSAEPSIAATVGSRAAVRPGHRRSVTSREKEPRSPGALAFPAHRPGVASERHHPFDDEPVELPAVADVGGGEVVVVLADVLGLEEDRRGDEPPAADLDAVDVDLVRHAGELALDDVVAGADVGALVAEEAVDDVARVLGPLALLRLGPRPAGGLLDDAEELQAAQLDERVDLPGGDLVRHAGVHAAVAEVGAGGVVHDVVVARPGAVTGVEGVARRLLGRVDRAGQTEAQP